MPFRFSLQTVLHLYESLEHQQEIRVRTANQQVARVRHMIEQIDSRKGQQQTQQAQELVSGTTSAELEFRHSIELELQRQRGELEVELVRVQQIRDEQQRLFRLARRRLETLDTLREAQLRQYQRETSRREQCQADALFLLRPKKIQ